jgi:hypothetical protein
MRWRKTVAIAATVLVGGAIAIRYSPYLYFRWALPLWVNHHMAKGGELSVFQIDRTFESVALGGIDAAWYYKGTAIPTAPAKSCQAEEVSLHTSVAVYESARGCLIDRVLICESDGPGALYEMYRIQGSTSVAVTYESSSDTRATCLGKADS